MYNLISFDTYSYMYLWKHHYNQDNEDYFQSLLMPICNNFFSPVSVPLHPQSNTGLLSIIRLFFLLSKILCKWNHTAFFFLLLFLSVSIIIVTLIHAVACSNCSFIFIAILYSILWMSHSFLPTNVLIDIRDFPDLGYYK